MNVSDIVTATLHAMAYDEPVVIILRHGGRVGPTYVVERHATHEVRDGTSVAIGTLDGQRIHLADIERVRLLDEHDQAPPPRQAGAAT